MTIADSLSAYVRELMDRALRPHLGFQVKEAANDQHGGKPAA